MSNIDAFEAMVAGQLPPDEWYEHQLDGDFYYLEPNSILGGIAVGLANSWEDAYSDYEIAQQYTSEVDRIVHAEEIEAADNTLTLAQERYLVFEALYGRILKPLSGRPEDYRRLSHAAFSDPSAAYQTSISRALEQEVGVINRYNEENEQPELIRFAQEVCTFYALEEGQHFRELLTNWR